MARFTDGMWQGHKLIVRPTDWRKWLIGLNRVWTPPYNVASRVRFSVEIVGQPDDVGEVYLNHLPFRVQPSNIEKPHTISYLDRYTTSKFGEFDFPIPSEGSIEIYVGDHKKGGSETLVVAEARNPSHLFIGAAGTLIGILLNTIFGG